MKKIAAQIKDPTANIADPLNLTEYFDAPDDVDPISFLREIAKWRGIENPEIKVIKVWDFEDYLRMIRDDIQAKRGYIKWAKRVIKTARKDLEYLEWVLAEEEKKLPKRHQK